MSESSEDSSRGIGRGGEGDPDGGSLRPISGLGDQCEDGSTKKVDPTDDPPEDQLKKGVEDEGMAEAGGDEAGGWGLWKGIEDERGNPPKRGGTC